MWTSLIWCVRPRALYIWHNGLITPAQVKLKVAALSWVSNDETNIEHEAVDERHVIHLRLQDDILSSSKIWVWKSSVLYMLTFSTPSRLHVRYIAVGKLHYLQKAHTAMTNGKSRSCLVKTMHYLFHGSTNVWRGTDSLNLRVKSLSHWYPPLFSAGGKRPGIISTVEALDINQKS